MPNVLNETDSIAYGIYEDTIDSNGWGILTIKAGYGASLNVKTTSNTDSNRLIMQAAGYLEGYLTAK